LRHLFPNEEAAAKAKIGRRRNWKNGRRRNWTKKKMTAGKKTKTRSDQIIIPLSTR